MARSDLSDRFLCCIIGYPTLITRSCLGYVRMQGHILSMPDTSGQPQEQRDVDLSGQVTSHNSASDVGGCGRKEMAPARVTNIVEWIIGWWVCKTQGKGAVRCIMVVWTRVFWKRKNLFLVRYRLSLHFLGLSRSVFSPRTGHFSATTLPAADRADVVCPESSTPLYKIWIISRGRPNR